MGAKLLSEVSSGTPAAAVPVVEHPSQSEISARSAPWRSLELLLPPLKALALNCQPTDLGNSQQHPTAS